MSSGTPQIHVLPSGDEIQKEIADRIVKIANESISDHSFFTLGLSGGSVAKYVSLGLKDRPDINWSKWIVLFCDERFVPFESEDNTSSVYKRDLFDHVSLLPENTLVINPSLPTVQDAAVDYTEKIRKVYPNDPLPSFDLLLLGMGPDGHTCSLFPSHPLLKEKEKIVAPISDSPKPPPCRITLTFPVLNNAKNVFVISTGEGKAGAVRACLEPPQGVEPLPAGMVRPTGGELHWFLDTGAAKELSGNK